MVELLIVVAIAAMLLVAIGYVISSTFSVSRQQVLQVQVTDDARLQLQRIAGVIRSARPVDCNNDGYTDLPEEYWLQTAAGDDVSVLVDADGDDVVELVRYYVPANAPTEVRRSVTKPSSTCRFPAAPTSDVVVLNSLQNGAEPLFTFYSGPDDTQDQVAVVDVTRVPTVTRVQIQLLLERQAGSREADTAVVTDATPRARPCAPRDCMPLPADPVPQIAFEVWPAQDNTARGSDITVNDQDSAVLSWIARDCDATPEASNDHGYAAWQGQLASMSGQRTVGPLDIATPTRRYSVSCSNAFGTTTATVTVSVINGPVVRLTSPTGAAAVDVNGHTVRLIANGESFVLDWSVERCDGVPVAANDAHTAGYVGPFVDRNGDPAWDGDLSGTSGSETYTFPRRQSPAHAPPVRFTLDCTDSSGIHAQAVLYIGEAGPPGGPGPTPVPPEIALRGMYNGQSVSEITIVNQGDTVDLSWESAGCLPNSMEASGSWSGARPTRGAEAYVNTRENYTHEFVLTCDGANGQTASDTLRFQTPRTPSFACRLEGHGWKTIDGGCAYLPDTTVWLFSGTQRGDRLQFRTNASGRSDWILASMPQLRSLLPVYNSLDLMNEKGLYDMLHVGAVPNRAWWSSDRVSTQLWTRNIATSDETLVTPNASQYGLVAYAAPLQTPLVWRLRGFGPRSGIRGSDTEIWVAPGESFELRWNTALCVSLDPIGPTGEPSEWNSEPIPTTDFADGLRVMTMPQPTLTNPSPGAGIYSLRCLDEGGVEVHRQAIRVNQAL